MLTQVSGHAARFPAGCDVCRAHGLHPDSLSSKGSAYVIVISHHCCSQCPCERVRDVCGQGDKVWMSCGNFVSLFSPPPWVPGSPSLSSKHLKPPSHLNGSVSGFLLLFLLKHSSISWVWIHLWHGVILPKLSCLRSDRHLESVIQT